MYNTTHLLGPAHIFRTEWCMSLVGVGILHGCFKNSDWSQLLYTRRNNWKLAFPGVTVEIIQEGTCLQFSPSVSLGQRSGKISGAWMRTFAGLETNFSSWIMLELNEALNPLGDRIRALKKLRLIQKVVQTFFYQALGSACTILTEHQAHFCLQPSLQGDLHPQVRFSIAFSNLTLGNTTGLGDWLWFHFNTSIKEALIVVATQIYFCPSIKFFETTKPLAVSLSTARHKSAKTGRDSSFCAVYCAASKASSWTAVLQFRLLG